MQRWARNVPLPEPHLVASRSVSLRTYSRVDVPGAIVVRLAGLCLVGAGLAWAAWATWVSVDTRLADPDRLIRRGPYAVSRNPMYVGWTVAYLGVGLALANVWLCCSYRAFLLCHPSRCPPRGAAPSGPLRSGVRGLRSIVRRYV